MKWGQKVYPLHTPIIFSTNLTDIGTSLTAGFMRPFQQCPVFISGFLSAANITHNTVITIVPSTLMSASYRHLVILADRRNLLS